MDDEIKFTCSECGKQFDPDPDTMCELEMGLHEVPSDQAAEMVDKGQAATAVDLQNADEEELKENGLTRGDVKKMMAGETIKTGGICVCLECQDKLSEDL